MQNLKDRFTSLDKTKEASIQSCVRTNDLDLIGDGTHLSLFQMIGNFSFGNNDYEDSCKMWHDIIQDLSIKIDYVTCHPSQKDHKLIFQKLGYRIKEDVDCQWSDGEIGGYCCEMFVGDLEIGNMVNTLGHSVDVGFGLERLLQVVEDKSRVDESSIFQKFENNILRDHVRLLDILFKNEIKPGTNGRNYICRKVLRRVIFELYDLKLKGINFSFDHWIDSEFLKKNKAIENGKKFFKKFKDKDDSFWWDTFGLLPDEIPRN